MTTTNRAFRQYEQRFTDGPEIRLFRCLACTAEVESVDSHTTCEECAAARDAADERQERLDRAAARGCEECGGYGVVRSHRMSPEADCDLEACPACHGESEPADCAEANDWADALRAEAIEHECAAELAAERALPHRAAA